MVTLTVEINNDAVDDIIRQELTTYLRACELDVRRLETKAVADGGLHEYEREDLAHFEDSIEALTRVIRLYSVPGE